MYWSYYPRSYCIYFSYLFYTSCSLIAVAGQIQWIIVLHSSCLSSSFSKHQLCCYSRRVRFDTDLLQISRFSIWYFHQGFPQNYQSKMCYTKPVFPSRFYLLTLPWQKQITWDYVFQNIHETGSHRNCGLIEVNHSEKSSICIIIYLL